MSILISNDTFWRGDIEKITGAQLCNIRKIVLSVWLLSPGDKMRRKNGRPAHLMQISEQERKDCAEGMKIEAMRFTNKDDF